MLFAGRKARPALKAGLAPIRTFPFPSRMSERLNELRRQRGLVQEQLAWLDREISRETHESVTVPAVPLPPTSPQPPTFGAPAAHAPAPVPVTAVTPQRPQMSQADIDAEAARILAQYRNSGASGPQDARRSLIIAFLGAMTLLFVAVGAWMLITYLR
jgi:hypothetical protein